VKFNPLFTPRGEHYCLEEWRGEQRISSPGDNFTPGGQLRPGGSKFVPRSMVARWFIFKTKIPIWVNFCGPLIKKCIYILWPIGIFTDILDIA
jgi:hypothetical protein